MAVRLNCVPRRADYLNFAHKGGHVSRFAHFQLRILALRPGTVARRAGDLARLRHLHVADLQNVHVALRADFDVAARDWMDDLQNLEARKCANGKK